LVKFSGALLNIHDLAKQLNVSIGTVSRALNGKAGVKDETRKRVLEKADELGYSPNQSGRSLRQGTTGLIGFMIITNRERAYRGEAFFMSVLDGLQTYLAANNMELVVHLCGSDQDPELHLRRVVERRLVDGIILSHTLRRDGRIAYLNARKLPFIAFGRSQEPGKYNWLDLDFEGAAEQAIDHLVELGHRRIVVATAADDINFGHIFVEACRSNLARHGIGLPDEFILREALTEAGGYKTAERILEMDVRPTAVVLVESTMAIGFYHKFHDVGLEVGKDISVIGFDNSQTGDFLKPPLTHFRLSHQDLGGWLGENMLAQLAAKAGSKRMRHINKIWPLEMIIGKSTSRAHDPAGKPT
jgi:DNA-binding LacI/PurR family transcriptional regulator